MGGIRLSSNHSAFPCHSNKVTSQRAERCIPLSDKTYLAVNNRATDFLVMILSPILGKILHLLRNCIGIIIKGTAIPYKWNSTLSCALDSVWACTYIFTNKYMYLFNSYLKSYWISSMCTGHPCVRRHIHLQIHIFNCYLKDDQVILYLNKWHIFK